MNILLKQVMITIVVIIGLSGCTDKPATGDAATPTSATPATPAPTTPAPTTPTTAPTTTPVSVNLSASSFTVLSDGIDSSTVTATILDASNAVVENATVLFSASGGTLSAASGVSDVAGKVQVIFSSGTTGFNGVETVTATLSGITPAVTRQLPIQIVGTTVDLVAGNVSITDDLSITDTLQVTVRNASNAPLYNVPVTVTQAGTGLVTATPSAVNTDVNGKVTIAVAGTTAGNVTLTVAAAGATATQQYTVSVTGTAFGITAPAVDPYAMAVGDTYTITVNAPGVTTVTFATTTGTLLGTVGPAGSVVNETVVGGVASVIFTGGSAGVANIQVYDQNNPATQDFTKITVSPPLAPTSLIRVQTSNGVIPKSEAGLQHTAVITATVTDALNQPIGNAPVSFSIPGVASGASISPVLVFTDANGIAQSTFTSGNLSSGAQGIDIFAEVVGFPAIRSNTNIIVGATAGSIFIGTASKVVVPNATEYQLPMSVIVTDSSGGAVSGAVVSLEIWPEVFRTGYWYNHNTFHGTATTDYFEPCITGTFINEDLNKNLILDAGEDVAHNVARSLCDPSLAQHGALDVLSAGISYPANTQLDAPQAAAGSLPISVVTDANGIANFDLTYLKASAIWIDAKVTAKTQVLGTESSSSVTFALPGEAGEAVKGELPDSSFGR
ncbi:MAG TPA: hypothetical protein EYG66_09070 [Mariprofundaceae bacterium]|nr:hypothetical protein [Mariprofundaceae bacterium]